MAHAQRCPICGGTGKTPKNLEEIQEESHRRDTPMSDVVKAGDCHGCHGRGWVEVVG